MTYHPARPETGRYLKIPLKGFGDAGGDGAEKAMQYEDASPLFVVAVVVVGGGRNGLSSDLHRRAV